jgi:hypothetical protein
MAYVFRWIGKHCPNVNAGISPTMKNLAPSDRGLAPTRSPPSEAELNEGDWLGFFPKSPEASMIQFKRTLYEFEKDHFLPHLQKLEWIADVELAYGMLSDFAHPNMASHATVVDRLAQKGDIHRWRLTPHPGTERGEFIVFMTLPTVYRAFGTIVEMSIPAGRLLERWLDLMDDTDQVQIDFGT